MELKDITRAARALYISTYVPRKCGIATFTKNLTNAINLLNPLSLAQIAAMDNVQSEQINYPHEVKFRIKQDNLDDYMRVVDYVNTTDEFEVVVVQHEFGIFGGENGKYIVEALKKLDKPVITTLHTVLEKPTPEIKEIIKTLVQRCRYVVVMLDSSRNILKEVYGISNSKIVVIPHGVPDFPKLETEDWKKRLNLEKYTVMSSINLLSESKGIEYAIKALPSITKQIPNFLYLIVGETHPVVKANEGEKYRDSLKALAHELNVDDHVRFIDKYLNIDELMGYVGTSDIYVTPYLEPQQAASGSLAYAIGAGKACISTPYTYAKEMLGENRGFLIPFKDCDSLSQAVVTLCTDSKRRNECQVKAYDVGRVTNWHSVGHQYFHLLHHV